MGTVLPSLVRWGMTPDADLVYRTLVSLDTAREGQLAHELGMSHERVREAMRELAGAGAIRRVASTSRRAAKATGRAVWAARQPSQVVSQLHVHRTRHLALVGPVKPPRPGQPSTPTETIPMTVPQRTIQTDMPAIGTVSLAGAVDDCPGIPHQAPCQAIETLTDPQQPDGAAVTLSPRERAIVELLAQGHTDETAARELDLSRRTVGYALGGLMSRLGVDNRFQLGLALGAMKAASPVPRPRGAAET
jgi:DNA-binding CsgD family transcriptional regulator/predicted DNA-binding transcriptional regulator